MPEKECGKNAACKVVWGSGKIIAMCEDHEKQVRKLCGLMGWPLTIISLEDPDTKCESMVSGK